MGRGVTWTNIEELGERLYDVYPEENPLDVELPQLRDLVEALDGFDSSGLASPREELLESIWIEWYSNYSAGSC